MQNPIKKFRQSSIVFEKPSFLSEKLKTLTSSNYHRVQYLLLKLRTRFLLTNVYKWVSGIFSILFRSWVIWKNQKRSGFYTLVSYTFINNSRSKQNKKKKSQTPFCRHCKVGNVWKFQQKILNFVAVGARQSFQFFRQIAWFLGNNKALSKFRYRKLCNLISITKL